MKSKTIGLIYSKKLNKIDFEKCFLNVDIQNIKIVYPYTENCNDNIKNFSDRTKVPILEINLGDTDRNFLEGCQKIVQLSDTILAICKRHESYTSLFKAIINHATTLNKKIIIYKQEKEKFYTSKGDLICGQNIL